jgi:hypothetical protein
MDARFFVLAFLAALNPKLFAVDLLLMESRRPRLMFLCFLAGGLSMCLTVGFLAVSAGGDGGALSAEAAASAGLDLAVGIVLLVIGGLLAGCTAASGHLPRPGNRSRTAGRSGSWQSPGSGLPC